jgi:HEAT repeat protein
MEDDVPNLIEQLESGRTRRDAIRALSRIGEPAVEPLINYLHRRNWKARKAIVEILSHIGGASALDAIVRTLGSDRSKYVRVTAAKALGRIGARQALPDLVKALQDKHLDVQKAAVMSLGQLNDMRAVRPLAEFALLGHWLIRTTGVEALSILGDAKELPRKLLASPDLQTSDKIDALEYLQLIQHPRPHRYVYPIRDIPRFCEQKLRDPDAAVRTGAQAILEHMTLVRGSERNLTNERGELLRGAAGSPGTTSPAQLLRASVSDGAESGIGKLRDGPSGRASNFFAGTFGFFARIFRRIRPVRDDPE